MESSLHIKWTYYCAGCGALFAWDHYQRLKATDAPRLPCGCRWEFLRMKGQYVMTEREAQELLSLVELELGTDSARIHKLANDTLVVILKEDSYHLWNPTDWTTYRHNQAKPSKSKRSYSPPLREATSILK